MAHVRPDLVGLAAGVLLKHAQLTVEVDHGPGRGLVDLEALPDGVRRVVGPLNEPLARDVILELGKGQKVRRQWRSQGMLMWGYRNVNSQLCKNK